MKIKFKLKKKEIIETNELLTIILKMWTKWWAKECELNTQNKEKET